MITADEYLSGKINSKKEEEEEKLSEGVISAREFLKSSLPEVRALTAPEATRNATWTAKTSGNDTRKADLKAGEADLQERETALSNWETYLKAAEENISAARKRYEYSGDESDYAVYSKVVEDYNSGLSEAQRAAKVYQSLTAEYNREADTARREYQTAAANYEGQRQQWNRVYSGWLEAEKLGEKQIAEKLRSELISGGTAELGQYFATPEQLERLRSSARGDRQEAAKKSIGDYWELKGAELGETAAALLPFKSAQDAAAARLQEARAQFEQSGSEYARLRDEATTAGAGIWPKEVLESGITQAAGGMAGFVGMVDDILGIDPENQDWALLGKLAKNVEAEQAAAQERLADTTKSMGRAGQVAANLGVSTIAAIPNAVFAILSGGASAAAQGLGYTAQGAYQLSPALSTAAGMTGMKSALYTTQRVMSSMARNPSYWSSFVTATGDGYKEAIGNGISQHRAVEFALLNGVLNAAIEVGGGIETLPAELLNKQTGNSVKSVLKDWIQSAAEEGLEEIHQGITERLLNRLVTGEEHKVASVKDREAIFSLYGALDEFMGGFVVGGILGGAESIRSLSTAADCTRATEKLNAAALNLPEEYRPKAKLPAEATAESVEAYYAELVQAEAEWYANMDDTITPQVATSDLSQLSGMRSANQKIASRSNSDTSVTAQDRATGSDTRQYQSPPGDHVQDERKSDGYAATIPQSGEAVKGAARPNLEEIRGRDVDAMTVNGLEYSVTATVNGYTARIADGNTTLWVKRGIENRTRAVDALEEAEVAGRQAPYTTKKAGSDVGIQKPAGASIDYIDAQDPGVTKRVLTGEEVSDSGNGRWNMVAYEDNETKQTIQAETHQRMSAEGKTVTPGDSASEYYPDLRSIKKSERNSILKGLMAKLKAAIKADLESIGQDVVVLQVGDGLLEARLYSTGIREELKQLTRKKANMLFSTREIFSKAEYMYSTPDYDGDPDVYRWDYFYVPLDGGNENEGVRIAVREIAENAYRQNESQIYNWGIKKVGSLDGERPHNKATSFGVSSEPTHESGSVDGGSPYVSATSSDVSLESDSAATIPQSGEAVKGAARPNLEEIRGRDVDAMTVNGLEYSVTATVNGYTARIADGNTTLWVKRGIENRTRAVDALEDAEVARRKDPYITKKAASDSVNAGNPTYALTSETAGQTTASAATIPQSGETVKGAARPNLEEIRGRDVDAMTVNGLEYSVTATVNGYTARIADGNTTLWVKRGIENRTRAVDALEEAEVAGRQAPYTTMESNKKAEDVHVADVQAPAVTSETFGEQSSAESPADTTNSSKREEPERTGFMTGYSSDSRADIVPTEDSAATIPQSGEPVKGDGKGEWTAENITEQEDMNDGRGNGTDGDTGEADADSRREGGGSAELSPAEWAARRAQEAADGEEIRVGGYTLQHTYIPSEEDSGCRLAARDIPEAAKVVFFTGEVRKSGILMENVNGTVSRDGTVYLRADSRERDVRQSARHERWHLLVMKDTQLGIRGEEALRRVYSDTELESLMAVYRDIYEIAYGVRDDNGNLLNADAVDQKVLQEICADAYAFIAEHDERISAASGEINRTQAEEYKAWKQRQTEAAEAAEKERQGLLLQKTLADLVRGRSDKSLARNLNAMGTMTLEEMKAAIREVLTEMGVTPSTLGEGKEASGNLLDLRTDAEIAEAQKQERRQQRAQVAEEKRRSRETSRAEAAKEYAQRRVTLDRDRAELQQRISDSTGLTGEARRLEMLDISDEYTRLEYEEAELTRLLRKSKGLCSLAIDEESNHIDRRSADAMGERDIKAFGYDYPELHPYYAEAAGDMLSALDRSVKGERFFSRTDQEGNTDVDGLMITAQNRQTIPTIAWLLDDCGLSYARIENACKAIAENSDKQNNRDAKLVELALDTMLTEGWTDMDGYSIPENQEYINAKSAIPGANTAGNDAEGDAYELPLSVGKKEPTYNDNNRNGVFMAEELVDFDTDSASAFSRMKRIFGMNEREYQSFSRSFSNQTSDLQEGDTRSIIIHTAHSDTRSFLYFIEADGYRKGTVLAKIDIDRNRGLITEIEGEIRDGINTSAKGSDSGVSSLWDDLRRYGRAVSDSDGRNAEAAFAGASQTRSSANQGGASFDSNENIQSEQEIAETEIKEVADFRRKHVTPLARSAPDSATSLADSVPQAGTEVKGNVEDDAYELPLSVGGKSFDEDKYYARQIDRWETLEDKDKITVGRVKPDSPLNQVGMPVSTMKFDVGKIKKAMSDHSDHLTLDVLKKIPDLLNDPIAIAEYTGRDGTIRNTVNVYGEVMVGNSPVVVGVVMHKDNSGTNVVTNIRTIHARRNFANNLTDDCILYLNEDKKRTRKWFHDCGNLNVPLAGTKFGLIRKIAYMGEKVKQNIPDSALFSIDGGSDPTSNGLDENSEGKKRPGKEKDPYAKYYGMTEEEFKENWPRDYSWEELSKKPPVTGVLLTQQDQVPMNKDGTINVKELRKTVESRLSQRKDKSGTKYFAYVKDLDANVEINNYTISHGLQEAAVGHALPSPQHLRNARAALALPQLLEGAVEVNIKTERANPAIPFSRVLLGVFGDADSIGRPNYYAVRMVVEQHADRSANLKEWEILGNVSAVNAKKIVSGDVLSLTNEGADIAMQDTIEVSVPELLETVKEIFPDSFSNDVYGEFGMERHDAPNAGNHKFTPGLVFSLGAGSEPRTSPWSVGRGEAQNEYEYPVSETAMYSDGKIYSYDFLTHQADMQAVSLPSYSEVKTLTRAEVAEKGLQNVSSVGRVVETRNNGKVGYIKNRYTNHVLQITGNTIRHGLNRSGGALILNEQLGLRIGEIAQNAIPINGLTTTAAEAQGTYAMAGYAYDNKGNRYVAILTVEHYTDEIVDAAVLDVGHSVNGRIENSGSPSHMSRTRSEELFLDTPADKIKISDFLDIVNSTHRSILSSDVLDHFGEARPTGGVYSDSALFSIGGEPKTSPWSAGRGEAQNEYEYPVSETAMYSDGKIYSYDFLTHQKPLKLVTLPDISAIEARGNREQFRDNVQRAGMQNAKEHGTADGNFAYVKNSYSGRTLRISKETILHSLDGNWARMNDNGRFGAVIGEVIQNAIPINALKTSKNQVYGTYAMAAYAKDLNRDYIAIITVEQRDNSVKDIKLVDVAHSVSVRATKRSEASTVDQVPGYDSEIRTERNPHTDASSDSMSIADFLQIVKRTHQGILSDDVRSVIGGERRADSRWGDSALFSIGGSDNGMGQVEVTDENGNKTGFAALNGREQDNERSTRPPARRDFGGTEATEKAGIRISGSLVGNWGQTDMLRAQNEGARLAGENARAAERYFHPSPAMKAFAQGVAEGIYTLDQTPQDMNRKAVAELSEAYRLRSSAEQGTLREQRRKITRNVQQAVRQLFADSEAYKSEAKGILKPFSKALMNERTPERVLRSIFGAEVGARAYNYLFRPMYENNAEKVRWMNRQKAEVETLTDSRGQKRALTDAEKECAQYVLEGRGFEYAMENLEQYDKNLVHPHVDAFRERLELQKDKNFERCSQWVQLIADKELDMADAKKRAKDLDCEELFEKVLENSTVMAGLRQLPEELQRIADGLNWYAQRKAEMETRKDADTTIVENAAKLYGEKYDLFYKVINEHLVMHGYDEIGYIEGYAPHMQRQETQSRTRKALSLLGIQLDDVSELPASIAGRTAEFKPNMRWNPHFQHRSGGTDYESNIVRGFESYLDYMGDIIYHTDDIMKLREAVNYYRSTYADEEIAENLSMANLVREGTKDEKRQFLQGRGLDYAEGMSTAQMNQVIDDYISRQYENAGELSKYSEFTTWLENAANLMAGKQSLADRGLEYSGGRKMLGLSRALMGSFAKANVAGSISSMLNQTAQLPMIITRLGEKYTLAAIRDMASGKVKAENFTMRSDYLTGKKGVDMIEKGSTAERALSALFRPAGMVDELISTVAVRGEYLRQLDKGMSDETALRRADDFGRRIMGSRVKGEKPQGFESKRFFSQMLHVFQVECMNTWDYVATDMPQEIRDIQERQGRNAAARTAAAAIVGYLLRAFLLNRLSDELYGGTPANMDLFGMTAEFFASGRGLPTNRYLLWAIDNGTEKLTDTRIFGTRREDGSEDFDTAEALGGLAYNVSNDLPYVRNAAGILGLGDQTLPTVGVNEIAKGAKSIWKGALGEDGKLGGGDAYGQQMVRGALDIAAQTVPMGRQLKKTATGAMTMAQGGSYSGYGDRQKLQYAVPGTVWNWSRALLFGNNALGEQEEFYAGDAKTLNAAETWVFKALRQGGMDTETAYDTMKEYDSIGKDKSMSSTERAIAKRKLLAGMQVEEPAKLEAWLSLEADGDVENGKYQGMLSLMEQGAKFGDLMGLYNRYQELESNDNLKVSEKATRFAQAVDELSAKSGWTEDMADEAKELWKYRVSSVVEARDYERLMDTGRISANEAVRVQQVWAGLQPEKGKESVSQVQKLYGIDVVLESEEKCWAAAETLMDTEEKTNEDGDLTEYGKLCWCRDNGVSYETYCDARRDGLLEGLTRYGEYMDTGAALKVSGRIRELEPLEGKKSVSVAQKAIAVTRLDIDEDYKLAYLEDVLEDSSFRRLDIATGYGVTAAIWGEYMSIRDKYDANGNGSYTQAEVQAAIESMRGLTTKQRAALWSMATLGKNNPFDRDLGTEFKSKAGK